ncbi:hypothetical protein BCR42DRAFT_407771 [Absidia repens]|uniref:Uncharacterized protein n=1 Tax=Absidia repens TaxID=90262 RepID=A0A1X2ISM0_9FUNG|nr:hypothetical protein BCR42DRAFT_407771 [Absidia repens]
MAEELLTPVVAVLAVYNPLILLLRLHQHRHQMVETILNPMVLRQLLKLQVR